MEFIYWNLGPETAHETVIVQLVQVLIQSYTLLQRLRHCAACARDANCAARARDTTSV